MARFQLLIFTLIGGLTFNDAFECYSCNSHAGADDSLPCVDEVEVCEPGVESCTVVSYVSRNDNKARVRKFCSNSGTAIFQHLLFFKGSALCQNIDTSQDNRPFSPASTNDEEFLDSVAPPAEIDVGPPAFPQPPIDDEQSIHRARRFRRSSASPPAPPHNHVSSLLCVCSNEKREFERNLSNNIHRWPMLSKRFCRKKENFKVVKCKDHVELITTEDGQVQFVKHRDLPYIPSLRLLHKYPFILPHQQVDQGAIRPVLNGSHIMCPGLKSPGARLADRIEKDQIVAVMAEGKEHAMAIGQQKMSSDEIRNQNAGAAIDNVHYLNDGLWRLATVQ
ncbi:PUA domain-containing protein [Aphelenchoides besseyi]|nr:PUA domain-containing protein [Aphelenchoides besseyi]